MKKFYFLVFLNFFLTVAFSQQMPVSIHQEQNDFYMPFSNFTEQQFDSVNGYKKTQLEFPKSLLPCSLNKIVFGWFPYWQGSTYNNFQWNKLSDLSFFSYEVDPATGNASTTHGWSTANVVTVAQQNGVRVNLCVTLFSSHSTFFGSSSAQQTLISNLISLVQQRNANGVNIDFEGVPSSQKTALTNFMIDLCNQFHAAIPNSQVSIALYAVDWNAVFDIPALNPYVDLFIIMGYDYYWGGSATAGPNDPLYHFGTTYNYTLSKSITYYLKQGVSPNKLILGLPYYGREYTTTSNSVPSSVLNPPNSVTRTFTTVMINSSGNYTNANKYWEGDSFSPYWLFNNGSWKQCFVDDGYSMRKRFDLVNQRGIGGIGIWALGYDDGYNDYWDALNDKFTDCAVIPCIDTIYDGGGPNKNYYDNENYTYTISPTGASSVSLVFSSFDVELNYDTLRLYDGPNTTSPLIGAYTGTNSPGTVNTTGGSLTYRFKSDGSTTRPGWNAIWNCTTAPIDNTPPTTAISIPPNWVTQNFTTTFSDADNVAVEKSYYQVLEFNGTEWRANNGNGFFSDNFDAAIHPDWTAASGNWNISNTYLVQNDTTLSNTNIYAPLTQNLSNRYLYHWQGKIDGAGTNRRAGFHFFCSDGNLPNHGNSYFVWFRTDDQKLQFYKVVNDTFNLEKDTPFSFAANQWYDFKVIYDRISGKTDIYVNNVFADSWTDSSPYSNGSYIAFRSGNSIWTLNDLKVYRSRTSTVNISIGAASTNDIRYQNPNPSTPSGRIKSILNDGANNLSSIASQDINVDWTPPSDVAINDGSSNDIDTSYLDTELTANWTTSVDTHSAVTSNWYAIGTSQGDSDVVSWTNNSTNAFVTHTGLSLTYGTTYFFSVKTENGAGLFSNANFSDGQIIVQPIPPPTANFISSNTTICNGETVNFQNTSTDATNYEWTFQSGNPATSTASNPSVIYTSSGNYAVTLIAYSSGNTSDTLTQTISVTVNSSPTPSFTADSTTVYLPNATVDFSNNSTDANSFIWNFGDGATSTLQNPSHTYSDTGSFTVTLIASNGLCNDDTLIIQNYIQVLDTTIVYPVPVAAFNNSSTIVCYGDYISFTNNSTDATSFEWIFSGGTPSSSTNANPIVIYDSSGTYSVALIATGQGGTDTLTQTINVVVNPLPIADFSANDTLVYLPNAVVNFTNNSSDATSFLWNFGDGNTSTITNPSNTYVDTGYYSVTLVAMNGICPDGSITLNNYIYVSPAISPPIAAFTTSSNNICQGFPVNFINSSTNATNYSWLFPGGNPSSSNAQNPSVVYNFSGTYNVMLIATGQGGTDTLQQFITVNLISPPNAVFSAVDTVVYLPNAFVAFVNNSNNAANYLWNFGDSATSTSTNPWHVYDAPGTYTVTLIALGTICPNDTLILENYIVVEPPLGTSGFKLPASGFIIYPNPNDGNFVISHRSLVISKIEIYNLLGKIVFSKQLTTNNGQLSTNLSKGIYFVELKTAEKNYFSKIVVK